MQLIIYEIAKKILILINCGLNGWIGKDGGLSHLRGKVWVLFYLRVNLIIILVPAAGKNDGFILLGLGCGVM